MRKNERKIAGYIDSIQIVAFYQQVESRGFKKKRAIEAAIRTWITFSAEIQIQIMASKTKEEIREILKKLKD